MPRALADQPHDTLFQETFRNEADAAAHLQSVLPPEVVALFDWSSLQLQSANLASGKTGRSQCDLLFAVQRADAGGSAFVYVLFEHQSTSDPLMLLRLLRYMVLIWERWLADNPGPPLPPILPVVLSHDERGWRAGTHFHELVATDEPLAPFIPSFEIVLDDLAVATDESLAARALPPGVVLTLWALRDARSPDTLRAHIPFWAELVAAFANVPGGQAALARVVRYVGEAAGERSIPIDVFADEVIRHAPSTSEVIMDSWQKFQQKAHNKGRAEGLEQGVAKGRAEALRETLLRLLRTKFGEPDAPARARVAQAEEPELTELLDRVLTADSLEAVLGGS